MAITKKLTQWLADNSIAYDDLHNGTINIPKFGVAIELQQKNMRPTLLTSDGLLTLNIDDKVVTSILRQQIDYIIYNFGGRFYYTTPAKMIDVELKELKYVGEYDDSLIPDFGRGYLAIHGRYEMMNGTRDYKDWIVKAKFLKYKALGIVEKHTLAGTLPFQIACRKNDIKSILGYTVDVEFKGINDLLEVKLLVMNSNGWRNLLKINKLVNIDQDRYVTEQQLFELSKGLIAVIPPSAHTTSRFIQRFIDKFDRVYFQITTNQYRDDIKDKELLLSIKRYLETQQELVSPILMSDAYVLDKSDVHIKNVLNKQGKAQFTHSTTNHYLRSLDELFLELAPLFRDDDERLENLFINSMESIQKVIDEVEFEIETSKLHLPVYEMTSIEKEKYGTTENMFDSLIQQGIKQKFPNVTDKQLQQIYDRVEREVAVIKKGKFVDYFLILWDIINYCDKNRIQVGPGRGSAAGSLVSYLLGIVRINPLRFDLIFERFLNESRIKHELPDIDIDFASDKRDQVIEYMKTRYGHNFVCRVGTYGTLQMRGVVKELARAYGTQGEKYNMNFITKLVSADNEHWQPLFKDAVKQPLLKRFIKDNPHIINDSKIALNAIKSASMHACATIIVPKVRDENGRVLDIFEQIPVRKDENGMLISEWEGDIMSSAGFLKEDILSTKQMAKFGAMLDMIESRTGVRPNLDDIDIDDKNVFELFKKGLNQDVFHFGSVGLTNYLKEVQPENIDELVASIALYRPGAMASNAHIDYVKLKRGELQPHYDYMLKDVTKDTYGLYIYQEQIMKAAQILGGFSLAEADGVRKAMGKKIKDKMDAYKEQFVNEAIKKGCPVNEAHQIWNKMEVFAGYGFNKSHAAAYSTIGYQCNWLKHYYPLEFWTVAFQYAKTEKIQDFVSEIKRMGQIQIVSPDINKSGLKFYSDHKQFKIYWNLSQIKYVGDAAAQAIIDERDKNGKFFSITEFAERIPSRAVNKRTVEHLVLAGCFDELYRVKVPSERYGILKEFFEYRKDEIPKEYRDNRNVDHYWSIRQSEISKLSNLNYYKLFQQSIFSLYTDEYISSEEISHPLPPGKRMNVMVVGTIQEAVIRQTKDKRDYAVVKIIQDEYDFIVRVWPQQLNPDDELFDERFAGLKSFLSENKSRLVVFRGQMQWSDYTNRNEIILTDRIDGPVYQVF